MSTEEFRMMLGFIGTMVAVVVGAKVLLAWINRPNAKAALPREVSERLERIERAVDTTALEVERIGESQRFLTRAIGERSVIEAPRGDSSGRVITPH